MVWGRIDDGYATEPKFYDLAAQAVTIAGWRRLPVVHRAAMLRGFHSALIAQNSKGSDGFLPVGLVEMLITLEGMAALMLAPAAGGAVMLHNEQTGRDCLCLAGRAWPKGHVLLHRFLRRNPSRDETKLRDAKKGELRDEQLVLAVLRHDRWHCRYCGIWLQTSRKDMKSAHSTTIDHVDPGRAEGASNLVACCRPCNRVKSDRLCEVAQMWPVPLAEHYERISAGRAAGCDCVNPRCPGRSQEHPSYLSDQIADQADITDPFSGRISDRISDPVSDLVADIGEQISAQSAHSPADQPEEREPGWSTAGVGLGRGSQSGPPAGYDPGWPRPYERAMHRPAPTRPGTSPPPSTRSADLQDGELLPPWLVRLLVRLPVGVSLPAWEIAELSGIAERDQPKLDAALKRLAGLGRVVREPAGRGIPVAWRRLPDPDPP